MLPVVNRVLDRLPLWDAAIRREASLNFRFVRRNRGWTLARGACQVSDRGRVRGRDRCESRRIVLAGYSVRSSRISTEGFRGAALTTPGPRGISSYDRSSRIGITLAWTKA